MKKQECVAMLLAGGEGSRLRPLTKYMAKPTVHFGAKYRMIDFALSNCRNSGIGTVGVLTQYKPAVLHAHIGSGDAWQVDGGKSSHASNSGISILERQAGAPNAYKGTADAIYQNLAYLQEHNPRYVLILSGDHIYNMDYRKMLEHHQATGAEATISVMPVKWEETGRFGIVSTDEQHRITAFAEKPFKAASNLASMGIYVFNWEFLKSRLEQDANHPASSHDFGHDIIPGLLAEGAHVSAYPFEGYWKDVGTIESLWESHMDLLGYYPRLQLNQEAWPVWTAKRELPKSDVALDARVNNAEIGEGVSIYGNVSHSVLFDGVTVVGERSVIGRHYPASIPATLTGTRLNFV